MFFKGFSALVLLAASAQATGGAVQAVRPESNDVIAANRYIIEFDSTAHLQEAGLSKRAHDPHGRFYDHLRERGVAFDVHQEYKNKGTFVGASVEITSASDLEKLSTAAGVLNVYPVTIVSLPEPKIIDISPSKSSSGISALPSSLISSNSSTSSAAKTRRGTSTGTYSDWSQLPMIQADLVHRTGNLGQGINIAIVDTGIDYTHASFGNCFATSGCKVAKGYDFVGDAFNPGTVETKTPDNDPLSKCNFHGTAVAGLAAGLDNGYDAPGVAPGANIFSYRVFGCTGNTYSDIELAAMMRAENDGADIINFSIGSALGWSGSPLGVAASNLAKKGIQCVFASGNTGLNGMFYAGSDSTDPTVIGAGSVDSAGDHAAKITFTSSSDSSTLTFQTSASFAFTLSSKQVYLTDDLLCNGLPSDAPASLANYIVVAPRGTCTFAIKATAAKSRNAAGIIFINNNASPIFTPSTVDGIPVAMITQSDGQKLRSGTGAGSNGAGYTATFPQDTIFIPRASAGRLTDFSSEGPTYDGFYTSKVTAPGFNVLAPYPDNRWTVTSGTSFSSPITAGAFALLLKNQQNKGLKRDLQAIRDAMFAAAKPVPYSTGKSESAASTGAGLVQVFNAMNPGTKVTPTMLTLNDTEFFQGTKYIVVSNTDTKSNNYQLVHQPSALTYGMDTSSNKMADYVNIEHDVSDSHTASVKFSRSAFTLAPGQSTILLMNFTAPSGVTASRLPVYSGQINILGGPTPIHLTYMGIASKMRDIKIISTRATSFGSPSPAMLQGVYGDQANEGQVFKFTATANTRDFPALVWNQLSASRLITVDLVDAVTNLGFTPAYFKRSISEDVEGGQEEEEGEKAVEVDFSEGIDLDTLGLSTLEVKGQNVIERAGAGAGIGKRDIHLARRTRAKQHTKLAARAAAVAVESPKSTLISRQTKTKDKLNAALKLWCQYTQNKGKGCTTNSSSGKVNTYAAVPTKGNILTWTDNSRDNNNIENDNSGQYTYIRLLYPNYSDDSKIPNGNYRFLIRALKVNGDSTQQADYDTWVSKKFRIGVGE